MKEVVSPLSWWEGGVDRQTHRKSEGPVVRYPRDCRGTSDHHHHLGPCPPSKRTLRSEGSTGRMPGVRKDPEDPFVKWLKSQFSTPEVRSRPLLSLSSEDVPHITLSPTVT